MDIIIDTREQQPWKFSEMSSVNKKLDTGDYSIEGLEDVFVIERKKATGELSVNLFGKDWKRFQRELVRMKDFKFAFLFCEFSMEDILRFPEGSGISKKAIATMKITSRLIMEKMSTIESTYGVRLVYCKDAFEAQMKAEQLFRKVIKSYGKEGRDLTSLLEEFPPVSEFGESSF